MFTRRPPSLPPYLSSILFPHPRFSSPFLFLLAPLSLHIRSSLCFRSFYSLCFSHLFLFSSIFPPSSAFLSRELDPFLYPSDLTFPFPSPLFPFSSSASYFSFSIPSSVFRFPPLLHSCYKLVVACGKLAFTCVANVFCLLLGRCMALSGTMPVS